MRRGVYKYIGELLSIFGILKFLDIRYLLNYYQELIILLQVGDRDQEWNRYRFNFDVVALRLAALLIFSILLNIYYSWGS